MASLFSIGVNLIRLMNETTMKSDSYLSIAESVGWDVALFEYTKSQVARGRSLLEDRRAADWIYFLPFKSNSIALSIGCGWGTVPIALSETCARVYAIDPEWERIKFLDIRKKQQRIDNLFPIYVSGCLDLPFSQGQFDFVSVSVKGFRWCATEPISFRKIVQRVYDLLKKDGIAYLSLGNRLAFQDLLWRNRKSSASLPLHTIFGYRRILKEEGFSDIHFYAPLPHHNGIPLFYLSLENTEALNYFFQNIFPLFEMASPEVKKQYGLQYKLVKIGVRLALIFRLTNLAKYFVPGFSIIATK